MKTKQIRRGDIYYAKLNPTVGSEQGDERPVLIIQNNTGNRHSPTTVIIPISCSIKKSSLPTHVIIPQLTGLRADSLALAEQIRAIDRSRLGIYIGSISGATQAEIDAALAVSMGIELRRPPKGEMFVLTLCTRCEDNFTESGYIAVRKGRQSFREICDFCNMRQGISFGVFRSEPCW